MEERVYKHRLNNVDEMKWRFIDVWHGLQQTVIDSAMNEWRKWLKACIQAQGVILNTHYDWVGSGRVEIS